ncbi:MAG: holo-ACP synthase [Pseudomonadota bacterium]
MIKGNGVDIVQVCRIASAVERHGLGFVRRILNTDEFAQYNLQKKSIHFLAKRFAAKEAISKALGTGMRQGVCWHDIAIINDSHGKPHVRLHGQAQAIAERQKINQWHLSLSDEKDYVIAFVIAD